MRIALVSEHASPLAVVGGVDAGGQNVYVDALGRALARRGHEVVVYTRRDGVELPTRVRVEANLTVEHISAGPPQPLPKDALLPHMRRFGRVLATRWAAFRPDVVHAHFWMSGLAALDGAAGLDVPVVQTFHALGTVKQRFQGNDDTIPADRLRLEAAVGRRADRVIATCTDELAELVAMGLDAEAVRIVPCGVDLDLFDPRGPALEPSGRRRLVAVGRLVKRKGIGTAIESLAGLPDTELLIAGGPDADALPSDPDVARLREVAVQYGVDDRVRFLGRVGREAMPALMRSADAVVTVPWYEPFGMVPLEAMACGRPVIAASVGGLRDTIRPGETGVLVPPRRADLLALAIRLLLADPARMDRISRLARLRAETAYSWDSVAQRVLQVYAEARGIRGTVPAQRSLAGATR